MSEEKKSRLQTLADDLADMNSARAPKPLLTVEEKLAQLLVPFPKEAVGKLPRATSKDAKGGFCNECKSWHKLPAVHLDYVGHATVRKRLLLVDPYWTWEPMAFTQDGLPLFILGGDQNPIGLWIRLTICGVSRIGFGSVDGNAFDPEKQLIGDAIRNAAMSFGVAVDLWSKDEVETSVGEVEPDEALQEARAHAASIKGKTIPQKGVALTPGEKEEAVDVFGAPAGARSAVQVRLIEGLPIYRTWESLKDEKIGKKAAASGGGVPSSKLVEFKTWQWASEGGQDGERETWLRKLIERAKELHAKNKHEVLAVELQAAVLAHSAMLDRIAPPPSEDKDATCPTQDSEV